MQKFYLDKEFKTKAWILGGLLFINILLLSLSYYLIPYFELSALLDDISFLLYLGYVPWLIPVLLIMIFFVFKYGIYIIKKNCNGPLFLNVMIVVLIFLAAYVGYNFYQNRIFVFAQKRKVIADQETLNWKVYRNIEKGFELKYPSDWVYKVYGESIYFYPQNTTVFCFDDSYSKINFHDETSTYHNILNSKRNSDKVTRYYNNGIEIIKFDEAGEFGAVLIVKNKIFSIYYQPELKDKFEKMLNTIGPLGCVGASCGNDEIFDQKCVEKKSDSSLCGSIPDKYERDKCYKETL